MPAELTLLLFEDLPGALPVIVLKFSLDVQFAGHVAKLIEDEVPRARVLHHDKLVSFVPLGKRFLPLLLLDTLDDALLLGINVHEFDLEQQSLPLHFKLQIGYAFALINAAQVLIDKMLCFHKLSI